MDEVGTDGPQTGLPAAQRPAAGLLVAAKWHDARAADHDSMYWKEVNAGVSGKIEALLANEHKMAAAHLRGLAGVAQRAATEGGVAPTLSGAEGEIARLKEALAKLHHAVCGPTGFAQAVRENSGIAYPWPALDEADELARAALGAP